MSIRRFESKWAAVWFCAATMALMTAGVRAEKQGDKTQMNQPPKGFTAIFNGENLSGWQGEIGRGNPIKQAKMSSVELAKAQEKANRQMRKNWEVKDGVLIYQGGQFDNLSTIKDYHNFVLLLDWKIEPHGDSGIYLRGVPQVQIWDYADHGVGSGGLYNNKKHPSKPLTRAGNPVGQWNQFKIRMVENKVWVWLNDTKVVDGVVLENYWNRGEPLPRTGAIELQAHHTPVYFRNIYIKELPDKQGAESRQQATGEWIWLFHGDKQDLKEHWNLKKRGWKVVGDTLALQKNGGYLWTEKKYGDFIMEFDFKISENANSGLFFRADPSNPVQGGMEIQIYDSHGKQNVGRHGMGAIYDVLAPRVNAARPAGVWQHMRLKADDNMITVHLNGKRIIHADLNRWTQPHQNPTGTRNKFNTAIADMPRRGHIGFQDHGHPIQLRNIRIKRLN